MRDKRFIAEHRGGPLKKERHIQLIRWSCACVEHVLPLAGKKTGGRPENALQVATAWADGKASVGDARNASVECIHAATEASDPVAEALLRAAGHAVATAHMADHSLGGALYALKAVTLAGKAVEDERAWQLRQLPEAIRGLVVSALAEKEKHFRALRPEKKRRKS